MIEKPIFPANAHKEFMSFQAGWSFGTLFYQYRPGLDYETIEIVSRTLRINLRRFYPEYYRLGFLMAYVKASGNRLPEKLVQERGKLMGKLSQAKQEVQQDSQFISAGTLEAAGSCFCITNIEEEEGNNGPQWTLNVLIDPELIGRPAGEAIGKVLTFSKGKDRKTQLPKENSRDRLLAHLMNDVEMPVHSVMCIEIPNANGYIDLDESTDPCPCGHVETGDDL